jgi:hypothetical protein
MSKRGFQGYLIGLVYNVGRIVGKVDYENAPYEGRSIELVAVNGNRYTVARMSLESANRLQVEEAFAAEIESRKNKRTDTGRPEPKPLALQTLARRKSPTLADDLPGSY